MKKYFTVAALVVLLGLTTGCGKTKVLKCSMTTDTTGVSVVQSLNATFKGKEVTDMDLILDYKVEKNYTSYINQMMSGAKGQFDSTFGNKKGIVVKSDKSSSGFTYKISIDFSKVDDATKKELNLGDTTGDYNATKKEIEKQGYTCK